MNGALREAEVVDPEWARRERRKQFLLLGATGGALVALAVGTVAFVLGVHNATEITQIRHSACEAEPGGEACQRTKRESARAETVSTACIPFRQVGYRCPRRSSTRSHTAPSRPSVPTGTAAPTPAPKGGRHSAPAPHHPAVSDHPAAPTGANHSGPTAAPAPTAPAPALGQPESIIPTGGTGQAEIQGAPVEPGTLVPSVLEATGATVGEVTGCSLLAC